MVGGALAVAVGAGSTAAATGSAAMALAATAPAPAITADRACYVNTSAGVAVMTITGQGFAPGTAVTIAGTATPLSAIANASGAISLRTGAPPLATAGPGTQRTRLTATGVDVTGAAVSATAIVRSANLAVGIRPGSVPLAQIPTRRVVFSFSGFTPGQHIYGFYLRRRVMARIRFARAHGPCGTLSQRALLYPGGHPTRDAYDVAFQSTSHYRRGRFPSVTGRLSILAR